MSDEPSDEICPHCGVSLEPPPREHREWCLVGELFIRLGRKDVEVAALREERDRLWAKAERWRSLAHGRAIGQDEGAVLEDVMMELHDRLREHSEAREERDAVDAMLTWAEAPVQHDGVTLSLAERVRWVHLRGRDRHVERDEARRERDRIEQIAGMCEMCMHEPTEADSRCTFMVCGCCWNRVATEAARLREERDRMAKVVQAARKVSDPWAHLSTSTHGTEVMTSVLDELRAALAGLDAAREGDT